MVADVVGDEAEERRADEARAPIVVTIGPEVGSVNSEPREAMSSIVPIVAGVSPRSSRTSGRRDSHAEVPKPRHT